MPYSLKWYIENEVIFTRFTGIVSTDELRECLIKGKSMIESSPRALIHVISDIGDVSQTVPLKDASKIIRDVGYPPTLGWIITIRDKSPQLKMGAAINSAIHKVQTRSFATMNEAINHLKLIDESLSWDKADTSILPTN